MESIKEIMNLKELDSGITYELVIPKIRSKRHKQIDQIASVKNATHSVLTLFMTLMRAREYSDAKKANDAVQDSIDQFYNLATRENDSYFLRSYELSCELLDIINDEFPERIGKILVIIAKFYDFFADENDENVLIAAFTSILPGDKTHLIDINLILELMLDDNFSFAEGRGKEAGEVWLSIKKDPNILEATKEHNEFASFYSLEKLVEGKGHLKDDSNKYFDSVEEEGEDYDTQYEYNDEEKEENGKVSVELPNSIKNIFRLDEDITWEITSVPKKFKNEYELNSEYELLEQIKYATYFSIAILHVARNYKDVNSTGRIKNLMALFPITTDIAKYKYADITFDMLERFTRIFIKGSSNDKKVMSKIIDSFLKMLRNDVDDPGILVHEFGIYLKPGSRTYLININYIMNIMLIKFSSFKEGDDFYFIDGKMSDATIIIERIISAWKKIFNSYDVFKRARQYYRKLKCILDL